MMTLPVNEGRMNLFLGTLGFDPGDITIAMIKARAEMRAKLGTKVEITYLASRGLYIADITG